MYDDNMTAVFSTLTTFVGGENNVHDYISLDGTPNSFNNDHIERTSEEEDCIDQTPDLGNAKGLAIHESMVFDTQEEVIEVYNQYLCKKNFGIQRGSSY